MVPALHYVAGRSWADSVAASLLVMVFTTPVGMALQHARGFVRWREGALLAVAGVVGVLGASALERFLPVPALKIAFAVLLLVTAHRLVRSRPRAAGEPAGSPRHHGSAASGSAEPLAPPVLQEGRGARPEPLLLLVAGLAAGSVAKLLGIGGGLVMVPALVVLAVPVPSVLDVDHAETFVDRGDPCDDLLQAVIAEGAHAFLYRLGFNLG
jgi:hypothetical protein